MEPTTTAGGQPLTPYQIIITGCVNKIYWQSTENEQRDENITYWADRGYTTAGCNPTTGHLRL